MGSAEPSSFSPVEIVRCIYDAYESGDSRTLVAHFDENIESFVPGFLPNGGVRHGLRELREGLAALQHFVTTAFEPAELIDAGDCVVAIGRTVGLSNITGQSYAVRTVHVWHFEGDSVVRFENYIDREIATLLQDAA